ncbi:hypothetical protein ACH4ZU_33225, partial [Streptomyces sp. NPDC020472]|uniref:hypothetical protein n=1 Tax=Streptomyces sp. NPDC020472 TaxID=3365075 RepID=UPI003789769F
MTNAVQHSAGTDRLSAAAPPRPGGRFDTAVEHVTGAQSLIRSLEEVGADTVFGIPGGCILPAYDP